jgi:hypothetical protein
VRNAWNRENENLYSAWIEKLFDAPLDAAPSWKALHDVLRDKSRNILYNHLGLGEDSANLIIRPDCADLPYFLRAYFAFKMGLPFGYAKCTRGGAHGEFADDRAAPGRCIIGRERCAPCPHGRFGDFGIPEVRRPALPLYRLGRNASVGPDQRKLALERLLGGEDDAQRRALPRRKRRGQDGDFVGALAAAGRARGRRAND